MRILALALALAGLALGAGSADGGDPALEILGFSFAHHVGPGSGQAPITLSSTFSVTVANHGSGLAVAPTLKVFVGLVEPVSVGLQLTQTLEDVEPGEVRTLTFERNAVPLPAYCAQIVAPVVSNMACSPTTAYTLP